ncbi:hypothetical protein GBA52_001398 [Prunus armeniaca]|nr:hypothetical protein GBA52_001398 [Prunus armeniaca]
MHQTLTNVVIPTFDIKNLQPTVFSSYRSNNATYTNEVAKLLSEERRLRQETLNDGLASSSH